MKKQYDFCPLIIVKSLGVIHLIFVRRGGDNCDEFRGDSFDICREGWDNCDELRGEPFDICGEGWDNNCDAFRGDPFNICGEEWEIS